MKSVHEKLLEEFGKAPIDAYSDIPQDVVDAGKEVAKEISKPVLEKGKVLEESLLWLQKCHRGKALIDRVVQIAKNDPELGIKAARDQRNRLKKEIKEIAPDNEEVNEEYNEFAGSALSLEIELKDNLARRIGFNNYRELENPTLISASERSK